jgi:hypothetical protein
VSTNRRPTIKLGTPSVRDASGASPVRHHGLSVNITPSERVGRIVLGLAAVVFGAVLLATAGSALAVVLEVLLIVAGLDLVVTGALGHCPLYQRLGHIPESLAGPHE